MGLISNAHNNASSASKGKKLYCNSFLRWALAIVIVSILSGFSSAFLLIGLEIVSKLQEQYSWLFYGLPLAGLLVCLLYQQYGSTIQSGNQIIVNRLSNKLHRIPLKLAPFIFLSTLWSHLFGASVGREGTAVQISTAFSDQINRFLNFEKTEQKTLTIAAIGAGFSSVFGAPITAAVFAFEVFDRQRFSLKKFIILLTTTLLSNKIALLLPIAHTHYPRVALFKPTAMQVASLTFASTTFGLCAWLYIKTHHSIAKMFVQYIPNPFIRTFLGSILIVFLVKVVGTTRYNGLGIDTLEACFHHFAQPQDFIFKIIFTATALSIGFKGGEVTPLFFIGATLGSALSFFIPLPTEVLAATGLVATFAAASKSPLASTILGVELFGLSFGTVALLGCFVAFFCSGQSSIYYNTLQYYPYIRSMLFKRKIN